MFFLIHAWGIPEVMINFIKRLPKINCFSYGLCTCGADAGLAFKNLIGIYGINSSYSVTMPNNYILGSDTESIEVIKHKIMQASKTLIVIAKEINSRLAVYRVNEGKLASLKTNLANWGF